MNIPLIFSHYGYAPYLCHTLKKARETNNNRRLILLGDDANRDVALGNGWEHFNFCDFSDNAHKRFIQSYKPIFGPKQRQNLREKPDAERAYLTWLKYVTERWFFINSFLSTEEIERFWHFDSDTMILQDLAEFEGGLSGFDFTTQCNDGCLNGLASSAVVREFCDDICLQYEDSDYIGNLQLQLDKDGGDHAFTEMAAFRHYRAKSARKGIWLNYFRSDTIFDDCLCQQHDFETVELPSGRYAKRVIFRNGRAYGRRSGRDVELVTLNLSWLPDYVFEWVSNAHNGCSCADIANLRDPSTFTDVRFRQPSPTSSVMSNEYNDRRKNAVERLRTQYEFGRAKLITFAHCSESRSRQKLLAASAIKVGDFDVIENWTEDSFEKSCLLDRSTAQITRLLKLGCCLWKPYICSKALQACDDGDLIVYADCVFGAGGIVESSVLPLFAWLSEDERRFAVSHNIQANITWSNKECFRYMDCDEPKYWNHCQFDTKLFAFLVGPDTRELINDWLKFCTNARMLGDDLDVDGLRNAHNFHPDKYDAAVLTNLLIRDHYVQPVIRNGLEMQNGNLQELFSYYDNKFATSWLPKDEDCISLGKSWISSTGSVWSSSNGVMLGDNEGRDFFFHTENQLHPWIELDLGSVCYVSDVLILNRLTKPFHMRARRMRVYAGVDKAPHESIFDATRSDWDLIGPLLLSLSGAKVRYIRVCLDAHETFHLKEFKVYGTFLDSVSAVSAPETD